MIILLSSNLPKGVQSTDIGRLKLNYVMEQLIGFFRIAGLSFDVSKCVQGVGMARLVSECLFKKVAGFILTHFPPARSGQVRS